MGNIIGPVFVLGTWTFTCPKPEDEQSRLLDEIRSNETLHAESSRQMSQRFEESFLLLSNARLACIAKLFLRVPCTCRTGCRPCYHQKWFYSSDGRCFWCAPAVFRVPRDGLRVESSWLIARYTSTLRSSMCASYIYILVVSFCEDLDINSI